MPQFYKINAPRDGKPVPFAWDTFRKGLNTILRENEIDKEELTQAQNILLIGKGIPTKRWGTSLFFNATQGGASVAGLVRGLFGYYTSNGTTELLAVTDNGFLEKRSGTSSTIIAGASWPSTANSSMAQLNDSVYIVNGVRELVRYSLPTLTGFPTIAVPSITGASNISNATGATKKGYRVSAVSNVGETLASTTFELGNMPATLGGTAGGVLRLFITPPSTASGVLQGMNVYGRDTGNERYLGFIPGNATIFNDDGSAIPREFTFPPTADSTGGPIAKYVKRFQDRLVFANLAGDPSKILISGKVPNHEKFDVSFGGNYLLIEPDSGDDITGIETYRDRIIVFKQKSIWQVTLSTTQIGNFFVTEPSLQLITSSKGCIAPRSIVPVENDVYFLSYDGVNSLGYEQGYAIDVLRSNEISVKVRPYFKNLTITQRQNAVAAYSEFKYIISFPSYTGAVNESMIFDRERLAWLGPWTKGATVFEVFYDTDGTRKLVFGRDEPSDTPAVEEFNETFTDDRGSAIQTILRTRQEDFKDWSVFKTIEDIFTQWRNITGTVMVDIRLEKRSGSVLTAKSFNVTPSTGNSGWGADLWGSALWGSSNSSGGGVDTQQTIRWTKLDQIARNFQITVRTTGVNDDYELLGIRGTAKPIGAGIRPSSWRT